MNTYDIVDMATFNHDALATLSSVPGMDLGHESATRNAGIVSIRTAALTVERRFRGTKPLW